MIYFLINLSQVEEFSKRRKKKEEYQNKMKM